MSESKTDQPAPPRAGRTTTRASGGRRRIDSILTIGGILDEQSLRMVVGGAAVDCPENGLQPQDRPCLILL